MRGQRNVSEPVATCPFLHQEAPPYPPNGAFTHQCCWDSGGTFLQKELTDAPHPDCDLPAAPRRTSHHASARAWGHLVVQYHGIDRCDRCGQLLEDGQWLAGLCRACEQAQKMPKRSVEILEPTKGRVS